MSREHFVESHLEGRVNELIYNENLSEEDAIQIATSEHDGQVNLVEDKALKIHKLETNFTTGIYSSAILVNKITDYLESNSSSDSQAHEVNIFCVEMMDQIVDWRKGIDNAE